MNKSFLIGGALICLSMSAQADWRLDTITYHGYCPPAAIKANLCKQGQDFVVDSNIKNNEVVGAYITMPKKVGEYVINQLKEDEGDLLIGSRVRVVWAVGDTLKKFAYSLLDNWQDLELSDLVTGDLEVTNILGKTFTATVTADDERISIRGMFTEPSSNSLPVNAVRDVTMTFSNSEECK